MSKPILEPEQMDQDKRNIDKVIEYLDKHTKEPMATIKNAMGRFYKQFSSDGVADMVGWLLWCRQNEVPVAQTLGSLIHDLNDCMDPGMSPRTWGYRDKVDVLTF